MNFETKTKMNRLQALANQVETPSDPLIAQVLSLKGAPSSSDQDQDKETCQAM
jgi:hypothetical protein